MRTATGLALVAVGAILAFAVTSHPSFLNLQIAGWVILLTGVAGMVVPRRAQGWLRRRVVVRRPRSTVVDPEGTRRALSIGRVLHRTPGPGTPLPEPRLPTAETTVEQTIPGTAQPTEETVEEFFEGE